MTIAIIGASGFIGSEVTQQLLRDTDYPLVLFSHRASKLRFTNEQEKRLEHVDGSVLNYDDILAALKGCDQAVYLVHLMGSGGDFSADEERAATNFGKAVQAQKVKRVIYVGGMGQDEQDLTKHLSSRMRTGDILREHAPLLIELRTPMVVGAGGAGFEVLKMMIDRLPFMPVPSWAHGKTRPITVQDVARYVVAGLSLKTRGHVSEDIGGPEQMTYVQLAKRYAKWRHKKLRVIPLPFVSQSMAQRVLRLFKQNAHAQTVADMIGSAGHDTHWDNSAHTVFPSIRTKAVEKAF